MTATFDGDEDYVGVSVFSGIGGLEHGFEVAGIPTAVQIEWDAQARRVLAERYPRAVRFGDVREVTVDAVRAVVGDRRVGCLYGGFPCQDVSVAGRRAGMAGDRSSLYTELVRLADGLDPEWVVVENVPGLLSADVDPDANGGAECREEVKRTGRGCAHPVRPELNGDAHGYGRGTAFAVVLGDLTGYRPPVPAGGWRNSGVCSGPRRSVAWRVLDARYFGVAQRRRRVFLVACAGDRAAPAAVLLEPEGVRGNPPPGEPPRPRFATRTAPAAVRAGAAGADRGGAPGARAAGGRLTADEGVTTALSASLGGVGADAAHAQAGWLVPTDDQPNEEVGALTASGGPSALDDQSTTQLVVGERPAMHETGQGWWNEADEAGTLRAAGVAETLVAEPTPLLEVNARTGRSTDDPECGIGIGDAGDPMFTLQAGKQHGVAYAEDPARPVGRRGRDDAGTVPELGDEPVMNALGTAGGGSGMPTVLAFEVDKERGLPNDEGIRVTEADVAPPLLADGDPAERTDRGVRIVQPWRKSRRAQTDQDDETWVEGDVANTLNNFDGGDTRATEIVVEAVGFTEGGTGQKVDDVAGTLTAAEPSETSARQNVVAVAAAAHTHHVEDGSPALTSSKEGPPAVAAYPIGQDALRGGEGAAATPSADAEGRVRLRDPGLGVYDDGDPAATVTAGGPGAVGVTTKGDGSAYLTEHAPTLQAGGGGQAGQGYAATVTRAQVRRLTPLECERLQGADDGWTDVDGHADSVRYRELGNAVCFAVSDWLGWRIAAYRNGWRPVGGKA